MISQAPSNIRRALDVAVALAGLAVLGIPLLLVMITIKVTSRGPTIFSQIRLGQGGRPFVLYKLRTMRMGSRGPDVTSIDDPRVTRLGRFLRSTSIDEIPQLWNVLRADMTLVGPRPETPDLASRYPDECKWVFAHRPGLTGPSQVRLRDTQVLAAGDVDEESYLLNLVPARTALDATYLANPSLKITLRVLGDTARHLMGQPIRSSC